MSQPPGIICWPRAFSCSLYRRAVVSSHDRHVLSRYKRLSAGSLPLMERLRWTSMPCGAPARGVDSSPAFTGRCGMARIVRCGLIQAQCEWSPEKFSLAEIKKKMIAKHERMIADGAKKKVQILGLDRKSTRLNSSHLAIS